MKSFVVVSCLRDPTTNFQFPILRFPKKYPSILSTLFVENTYPWLFLESFIYYRWIRKHFYLAENKHTKIGKMETWKLSSRIPCYLLSSECYLLHTAVSVRSYAILFKVDMSGGLWIHVKVSQQFIKQGRLEVSESKEKRPQDTGPAERFKSWLGHPYIAIWWA